MLYYYLLPAGNLSKTAKSVLSAVTLAVVLVPLFSAVQSLKTADFKILGAEEPSVSVEYDAYVKEGERIVRALVDETVQKYTDVPYETEIEVHILEDMRIDIVNVRIRFAQRFAGLSDLAYALKTQLGIAPVVETEAEE